MKFSTWNWADHPIPASQTKGCCIGPFLGVLCYVSTPVQKVRPTIQLKRIRHKAAR